MWYKIEVASDGGILSCIEVEASVASGKYIRYVEADSRAEAIKLIQQWWRQTVRVRKWHADRKLRAQKIGLCTCGQPLEGYKQCAACRAKGVAATLRSRARREGCSNAPPLQAPRLRSDSERLESQRRALDLKKTHGKKTRSLYAGGSAKSFRVAYERALQQFDRSTPRAFRAWLVTEITRLTPRKSILQEALDQHPAAAE